MRIGEDPPLENWIADVCTPLTFKLFTVFSGQSFLVGLRAGCSWRSAQSTLSAALRRLHKSYGPTFVSAKTFCLCVLALPYKSIIPKYSLTVIAESSERCKRGD
jgi:hypothetical protein